MNKHFGLILVLTICWIAFDEVFAMPELSAERDEVKVGAYYIRKSKWTYGCDDYCWSKRDCTVGYCYTFHPGVYLTVDRYKWKCEKDSDCGADWECGSRQTFCNLW